MAIQGEISNWVVVYTRYKAERKLMQNLENAGFECCLPMIETSRKWSDRLKTISVPLLPGVLFVKAYKADLNVIYKEYHARYVLKEFGVPAIVKPEEIKNLKIIAQEWNGNDIKTCRADKYKTGDYIRIKRGNFKGLSGRLTEIKGRYRLLVELCSVNTAFSVNIPASQAEKIAPKKEILVSES